MLARDVMSSNVISIKPETKVFEAVGLLVNNKIGWAPVLDDNGDIVGVVTEKDLLVSLDFLGEKNARDAAVREFMSTDIISSSENMPLKEIMQIIVRKNIKRVPILNGKKVIGMVSSRDILRALLR